MSQAANKSFEDRFRDLRAEFMRQRAHDLLDCCGRLGREFVEQGLDGYGANARLRGCLHEVTWRDGVDGVMRFLPTAIASFI